ncbi:MAG: IS110 family transposase [Tannerellaceae bacterium]|jgi:hypothetical protein|nr:IS110 family transposase [Tannerellaceae bacterium]
MESTGIYWLPVWNILETMEFDLLLVNPSLIRPLSAPHLNLAQIVLLP